MVRAAAKNHAHVGVVVDPAQYGPVLDELRAAGALSAATRRRLARQAFARTAAYDAAIVAWLRTRSSRRRRRGAGAAGRRCHRAQLERAQDLRYGENPHQQGARYRVAGARSWWDDAVQHGGKELSYLNLYDTEAAWRLVHRFERAGRRSSSSTPTRAGSRSPTTSPTPTSRAHECDPVSAFGGIVAVNRPVPAALAEALAPVFTEVVVAPSFDDDALAVLGGQEEPPRAVGAAARRRRRSTCAPSTAACSSRRRSGLARPRPAGRCRPWRSPTEAQWRRPGARLAGRARR